MIASAAAADPLRGLTVTAARTTLVTGASSGIGKEIARYAAAAGDDLILVARREELLNDLAGELRDGHGVRVEVIAVDLTEPGSIDAIEQRLADLGMTVTMLVNNAGFGAMGAFTDAAEDRVAQMIDLNVRALTMLSRRLLPPMVELGWGRILNVASVAAFQPGPTQAVYHATKAFVVSFSQAIDYELRGTGVRASALCPGFTESEFHAVAGAHRAAAMQHVMASAVSVARRGYRGALAGKPVVIPGLLNRVLVAACTLFPRRMITAISASILHRGA